jgi:hypothetical protein
MKNATIVEDFKSKKVEDIESIKRRATVCLQNLNNLLMYPTVTNAETIEKANKYLPRIKKVVEHGSSAKNYEKRLMRTDTLISEVNLEVLKTMASKTFLTMGVQLKIDILSYLMTTGVLNTRTREIVKKQLVGLKYK